MKSKILFQDFRIQDFRISSLTWKKKKKKLSLCLVCCESALFEEKKSKKRYWFFLSFFRGLFSKSRLDWITNNLWFLFCLLSSWNRAKMTIFPHCSKIQFQDKVINSICTLHYTYILGRHSTMTSIQVAWFKPRILFNGSHCLVIAMLLPWLWNKTKMIKITTTTKFFVLSNCLELRMKKSFFDSI